MKLTSLSSVLSRHSAHRSRLRLVSEKISSMNKNKSFSSLSNYSYPSSSKTSFSKIYASSSSSSPPLRHTNCINHSRNNRMYTTYSQLPEEHQMIYEMCRKFADEELAPNAGKWDQKHEFPTDAVTQLVSTKHE